VATDRSQVNGVSIGAAAGVRSPQGSHTRASLELCERDIRILAVLPDLPVLEGGAAGRCAIGMLRGLAAHGVRCRAVAARRPTSANGAPPTDLEVEIVDVEGAAPWHARAQTVLRPLGELSRGAFGGRVQELAASADIIHLDQVESAWCSTGLDIPAVVNIHYLVRRDRQFRPSHALPSLVVRCLGELAATRRHDYFVANSPIVAEALQTEARHAQVVVAPLTLDPTHYAQAPLDGAPAVVVVGTGTWPPTAAALRRLVHSVWPHVRRQVPEATLRIAGRNTEHLGLSGPGVHVLGEIRSAAQFLRDASVLLFPLTRGSGMKVKVLEALACGVPVVTTPAGAEGLDPGEGVVVDPSGDDERLAASAVRLLRDDDERRARGEAARQMFLTRYTPERAVAPLADLYKRILG
jgi:glycosyltransferase involved in cell wall biosynthesis